MAHILPIGGGGSPSPPPGHIEDIGLSRCLDSNYNGAVYTNPCWSNDTFQKWHTVNIEFGDNKLLQNNQTGRCLDANRHQAPFTERCNPKDYYQMWDGSLPRMGPGLTTGAP